MIRIWKGPEMEGTKVGMMTLFVCSDREIPIKTIISQIMQNGDIRRVYFGAGRKSFAGVDDFKGLYDFLFRRSIEIIIETDFLHLDEFISRYDSLITNFIITRYEAPYTFNNLQYKTDNTRTVTIYNATSQTSLETLKENNLFTCDKMLLQED